MVRGFRPVQSWFILTVALLASRGAVATPIVYDLVTVGNPGNSNDPATGYGGVPYAYQIGTYHVTIGQYTAFLNAVAQTDTHGLYNSAMDTDLNVAGIARSGTSGGYTYAVKNNGGDSGNRPISYVDWFSAARFSNWIANGQPTGLQTGTTTENGAYALNGATSGTAPAANAINPNTAAAPLFSLPTENETGSMRSRSPRPCRRRRTTSPTSARSPRVRATTAPSTRPVMSTSGTTCPGPLEPPADSAAEPGTLPPRLCRRRAGSGPCLPRRRTTTPASAS